MQHAELNWTRYQLGQRQGHYESFYQRANHPTRPLAFWIRYTIFSPLDQPEKAIGELWAVFFNGETGQHAAVKEEHPLPSCHFEPNGFGARVGSASLRPGSLQGTCKTAIHSIGWDLSYTGDAPPLYLLPLNFYKGTFPKAKSLVGTPLAVYNGVIAVNGETHAIQEWVGSQNHNWGSKHTDYYAFGQVAGFDNAPTSFLELVSAQLKFGPIWTPVLTPLVLRHGGQEHALITLPQTFKAKAKFGYFYWDFRSEDANVAIQGRISVAKEGFVGLRYYNPTGGIKQCLNSKIADCELTLTDKATGQRETLTAQHRAVFEIFTDDKTHGIEMRV